MHHCHQSNPQKDHYRIYSKGRREIHTKFNRNQEEMRWACRIFFILESICLQVSWWSLSGNCLQGDNCTQLMLNKERAGGGGRGGRGEEEQIHLHCRLRTIGSCPQGQMITRKVTCGLESSAGLSLGRNASSWSIPRTTQYSKGFTNISSSNPPNNLKRMVLLGFLFYKERNRGK